MRTVGVCLTEDPYLRQPHHGEVRGRGSVRFRRISLAVRAEAAARIEGRTFSPGIPSYEMACFANLERSGNHVWLDTSARARSELRHAERFVFTMSRDADLDLYALAFFEQLRRINPAARIVASEQLSDMLYPAVRRRLEMSDGFVELTPWAIERSGTTRLTRAYADQNLMDATRGLVPVFGDEEGTHRIGALEMQMLFCVGGQPSGKSSWRVTGNLTAVAVAERDDGWRSFVSTLEYFGCARGRYARNGSGWVVQLTPLGFRLRDAIAPELRDIDLFERLAAWRLTDRLGDVRAEIDAYALRVHETQKKHVEKTGMFAFVARPKA